MNHQSGGTCLKLLYMYIFAKLFPGVLDAATYLDKIRKTFSKYDGLSNKSEFRPEMIK